MSVSLVKVTKCLLEPYQSVYPLSHTTLIVLVTGFQLNLPSMPKWNDVCIQKYFISWKVFEKSKRNLPTD